MPRPPFQDETAFKFDTGGLAALFGGTQAVSAFAQVHGVQYRRYLGWYNAPGGFEIARKYGQLANSKLFDGVFPGPDLEPAELFGLSGMQGPEYVAAHSGAILAQTGHIGRLFELECEDMEPEDACATERRTIPENVTIAELSYEPPKETEPSLQKNSWPIIALIPISVSAAACALAGVYDDWYTFALILVGMLANGFSCWVVGAGKFVFEHPIPAPGVPDGNGVLMSKKGPIVVLGAEGAVNSITRGSFSVRFHSAPGYHDVGMCALGLSLQFLAQLLLIPQSTLFGQVLFLISLGVSWAYNNYCGASFDVVKFQRDVVMKQILERPYMKKYKLGTRTAMAAFVMLVVKPNQAAALLNRFLPNESEVWQIWKKSVLEKLARNEKFYFPETVMPVDQTLLNLSQDQFKLLQTLFGDAEAAQRAYDLYLAAREAEMQPDRSPSPGKSEFAVTVTP